MQLHEIRFRVRYAETDQMGIVHHANYLVWMEMGRVEYCRSIGVNYKEMEAEDHIFLAVAEAKCRYRAPARYDDEVVVRTQVVRSRPRILEFVYDILLAHSERLLAVGNSTHVYCTPDLRPCKLPQKYHAAFSVKI